MDRKTYAGIVVMEECSEIAKVISKGLRFGFENFRPGESKTNAEHFNLELNDLLGALLYLKDHNPEIFVDINKELIYRKVAKIELMYEEQHG